MHTQNILKERCAPINIRLDTRTDKELQITNTISTHIFWLEILDFFSRDGPFISKIFRSVESKLSFHVDFDRKFRNV